MGSPELLIVEDDEVIGRSLCQALEAAGYAVQWVRTGAETAERLAELRPPRGSIKLKNTVMKQAIFLMKYDFMFETNAPNHWLSFQNRSLRTQCDEVPARPGVNRFVE